MTVSNEKDSAHDQKSIKVTDRRMFTPEGELREDYRFLAEEKSQEEPAAPPETAPPETAPPETASPPEDDDPETGNVTFFDLVSLLGENASVYIQQSAVPSGERQQHLELAQLHIGLLDVLKRKTEGRLGPREGAFLDDVLYRLRMALTQHGGR